MKSSEKILLGTSGWSYKEWVGPFYSKEDKSLLRAYTKVFKTVEIDSTFYRYPSKGMVMGWTKYSPEGFVFAAKLPKLITHEKRLDLSQGVEDDLQRFLELMEPLTLSGKLGCVLIQLPPKYDYKPKETEAFFKTLPTHIKFAVEFRNLSWMKQETWALLEKYKVAYANVDEPLLPPETRFTSTIAYFRWHGKGTQPWFDYRYKPEELEPWVQKVKEATQKVEKVFGYFNNHFHGYAVENCLQVAEMLGTLTPRQAQAKSKVENHFKSLARVKESTLQAFFKQEQPSVESLLRVFADEGRLGRAVEIKDAEVAVGNETPDLIEATVKNYHVIIDVKSRSIAHDCEDWGKGLVSKRFCKHIVKLFLVLERETAISLLSKIRVEKDEWQFGPYVG